MTYFCILDFPWHPCGPMSGDGKPTISFLSSSFWVPMPAASIPSVLRHFAFPSPLVAQFLKVSWNLPWRNVVSGVGDFPADRTSKYSVELRKLVSKEISFELFVQKEFDIETFDGEGAKISFEIWVEGLYPGRSRWSIVFLVLQQLFEVFLRKKALVFFSLSTNG